MTKDMLIARLRQSVEITGKNLFDGRCYGRDETQVHILHQGESDIVPIEVWNSVKADLKIRAVSNGIAGFEFSNLPTYAP